MIRLKYNLSYFLFYMLVQLKDLKDSMVIQSYAGLEKRFGNLSDEHCRWIMHNFKGALAQVQRQDSKIDIPIAKLRPGDKIFKVFQIPASLNHLTHINAKLIQSLETRKFTFFEVSNLNGKNHAQRVAKATQLIKSAKQGAQVKNKASKAIESIMDSAHHGVPEIGQLEGFVSEILEDKLTDSMSALTALKKSSQTYAHCVDVAAIFMVAYYEIIRRRGKKPAFKDQNEALMAAMLHDVGKGMIPKEVLESDVRFEKGSPELEMFRHHPQQSQEILKQMGMSEVAQNMALCHHIKASGIGYASYPEKITYSQASYEAKLLAVIDVYQSLVGRRPYKKSWTAPSAMRYIESLSGIDYDEEIWEDFQQVMGIYPIGSLVRLSDGCIGFVVNVPEKDLERPAVAVVKSSAGEILKKHQLVDLAEREDLTISEDLDPEDVFQGGAIEQFSNLKIA